MSTVAGLWCVFWGQAGWGCYLCAILAQWIPQNSQLCVVRGPQHLGRSCRLWFCSGLHRFQVNLRVVPDSMGPNTSFKDNTLDLPLCKGQDSGDLVWLVPDLRGLWTHGYPHPHPRTHSQFIWFIPGNFWICLVPIMQG